MSVTSEANPSLKWKGPSSGGTALPVEYDVDDPTFCSPKSVLSGLASGFCERWAVTHPEFIVAYNGGNSTTLNWNDADSAAAYRTSIVSNFVENIIVHDAAKMTMASAFCENNGDFMVPEHPTAGSASNYMTYMDNMITQLVVSGGYATNNQGTPLYGTFGELAASAHGNAPTIPAASSCGLPVSNASAYTSQFLPAYPAAWAKERKWMLEQLRYLQTTAPITLNSLDDNTEWQYILMADSGTIGTVASTAYTTLYKSLLTNAQLVQVTGHGESYENAVFAPAKEIGLTFYMSDTEIKTDRWDNTSRCQGFVGDIIATYSSGEARPADCPVEGTTGYANVYFGSPDRGRQTGSDGSLGVPWIDEGDAYQVSTAKIITMDYVNTTYGFSSGTAFLPYSKFVVLNGGTLTLSATAAGANAALINLVTVSSGGSLILKDRAVINSCCIMTGGNITYNTGYVAGSTYTGTVQNLFYDYKGVFWPGGYRWHPSVHAYNNGSNNSFRYATAATTLANGSSYLIAATRQVEANCSRLDIMAGTCTITSAGSTYALVVSSGAVVIMSNTFADYVAVLPGGTLSCVGSCQIYYDLYVMSGGKFFPSANGGHYPWVGSMVCVDGCTVTPTGYAVSNHRYQVPGSNGGASGEALYMSMYLCSFNDYGEKSLDGTLVSAGWNTMLYQVKDIKDENGNTTVIKHMMGTMTLTGTGEVDTATTAANEVTQASSATMTLPDIKMSAGVLPDYFEPKLIALAVNGGTATKTQVTGEDYYPSFKLRQNQT